MLIQKFEAPRTVLCL